MELRRGLKLWCIFVILVTLHGVVNAPGLHVGLERILREGPQPDFYRIVRHALQEARQCYAYVREHFRPDQDTRLVIAWRRVHDLSEELSESLGTPRTRARRHKPPPRHSFVVFHDLRRALAALKRSGDPILQLSSEKGPGSPGQSELSRDI